MHESRDAAAASAIRSLATKKDPGDSSSIRSDGAMSRPKRELVDRIPRVLELSVVTRCGVEATVNVLPSWRGGDALQLELAKESMDRLLEDPHGCISPSLIYPHDHSPRCEVSWRPQPCAVHILEFEQRGVESRIEVG